MSWAAVGGAAVGVIGSYLLAPSPNTSAGDAAANASNINANISLQQWQNYLNNFMPVQNELIAEARRSGSPEAIAEAEGAAAADVTGAFDRANRSSANRMRSYGINPASPAFSSNETTSGLAEGSAMAGARTGARRAQQDRAYSRMLDIVSIGRGLPATAAAAASGAAGAAGIQQNSINSQAAQNAQNQQNIGYGLQPLVGAGLNYYNQSNTPTASSSAVNNYPNIGQGSYPSTIPGYGNIQYAEGGEVGLEPARHGMRHKKLHLAVKGAMTPHMNRYANGGGVGNNQGLEPAQMNRVIDGPGTETSDSIPANIDGQKQAALSTGEFVMTAEVPKMTGEEILQAINRAGLEKRQGGNAYACGGKVKHGLR